MCRSKVRSPGSRPRTRAPARRRKSANSTRQSPIAINRRPTCACSLPASSMHVSNRLRLVRERALKVHKLVEKWHAGEDVKVNKPYVDLMFAFGLAKLAEVTAARDLMKSAQSKLLEPVGPKGKRDPAHEFLFKAFA